MGTSPQGHLTEPITAFLAETLATLCSMMWNSLLYSRFVFTH